MFTAVARKMLAHGFRHRQTFAPDETALNQQDVIYATADKEWVAKVEPFEVNACPNSPVTERVG